MYLYNRIKEIDSTYTKKLSLKYFLIFNFMRNNPILTFFSGKPFCEMP